MIRFLIIFALVSVFPIEAALSQHGSEMPLEHQLNPDEFLKGPQFRPEGRTGRGTLFMREVRGILDEMFENGMRDEFLASRVSWSTFRSNVGWAQQWIHHCRETEFELVVNRLQEDKAGLGERKLHLMELRERINEEVIELDTQFNELWDEYRAGAMGRMAEESAEELAGTAVERSLIAMSEDLTWMHRHAASGRVFASACFFSVLMALKSGYELGQETLEYAEMDRISPRLLERVEIRAYLDLLISQYENLEKAHDEMFNRLTNVFDADQCEYCVEKENVIEVPDQCPASSEPPRPNRHIDVRELSGGQRLMESGSGEKTLMGPNGKLQATIQGGVTTIYGSNGTVIQTINREMHVEAINQILEAQR